MLTLTELDRNKKGGTFAHDLKFDVLEPLTWAISSAADGEADAASEEGDEPPSPANDDDQADEAA